MEDFNSETDSDYTSYWRDWVSADDSCIIPSFEPLSCHLNYTFLALFCLCLGLCFLGTAQIGRRQPEPFALVAPGLP